MPKKLNCLLAVESGRHQQDKSPVGVRLMRLSGSRSDIVRHPARFGRRLALCALLAGLPGLATAANVQVTTQMQVDNTSTLTGHVSVSTYLWVGSGSSAHLVADTGLVGVGMVPGGNTRLDVQSSGSGYIQFWRNTSNVVVSTMYDTGILDPSPGTAMQNTIILTTAASCPLYWTDYSATFQGFYIMAMRTGATLAGTVGTALTDTQNRAASQHTHTATAGNHQHGSATGSAVNWATHLGTWGIIGAYYQDTDTQTSTAVTGLANTDNDAQYGGTSKAGTNAPYIQLRVCVKD